MENQVNIFEALEMQREAQKEEWKDIPGYEGLYQASNKGRIRSKDRWVKSKGDSKRKIKGKIIEQSHNQRYNKVQLWKDGKVKNKWTHRLIAKTFIPNPEGKKQVNHKDGNKRNNATWNLEWATAKENIRHAYRTGIIETIDIPYQELHQLYLGEKKSIREIADILDISTERVHTQLVAKGIPRRSTGYRREKSNKVVDLQNGM